MISSQNIRLYSQLIASIIKSSYFGIIAYIATLVLSKNYNLRNNNAFLGIIIFGVIFLYAFPLVVENSLSAMSYLKTLILWMLPVIYYSIGSNDLSSKMYERLLIIMLAYTVFEFLLINYTGISFFESDRLRNARILGGIRSEGVAHNASISSALAVSVFLKINSNRGFNLIYFLIASLLIIFLASGAGMLLFLFAILFFVLNRIFLTFLLFISLATLTIFISQFPAMEILGNIHPKISYDYISFLLNYKLSQINWILDADLRQIFFGFSILEDTVITSGDFGYLLMIAAIGLIPSILLLFSVIVMFVRASRFGNFAPFLILMIENIHYPVFVDPISAYVMAQYAIARRSEE
jgi:hypothetical protein